MELTRRVLDDLDCANMSGSGIYVSYMCICVSSYSYIPDDDLDCANMYGCGIGVYCYIFVVTLLYVCPQTAICVT